MWYIYVIIATWTHSHKQILHNYISRTKMLITFKVQKTQYNIYENSNVKQIYGKTTNDIKLYEFCFVYKRKNILLLSEIMQKKKITSVWRRFKSVYAISFVKRNTHTENIHLTFSLCRSHFRYFFLDVVWSGWRCSCGYFTGLRRVDDDDGLHFDATHCRVTGSFSCGGWAFEAFVTRYLTSEGLKKNYTFLSSFKQMIKHSFLLGHFSTCITSELSVIDSSAVFYLSNPKPFKKIM